MLFDRRIGLLGTYLFDVGRDVERLDTGEGELLFVAPGKEGDRVMRVGLPCVGVTNLIGEEGGERFLRCFAGRLKRKRPG